MTERGAGQRIVKTTSEARQGVTGHNVRYVLVVGTLTVIALFVLISAYFFQ
jgi:hypothetical protein